MTTTEWTGTQPKGRSNPGYVDAYPPLEPQGPKPGTVDDALRRLNNTLERLEKGVETHMMRLNPILSDADRREPGPTQGPPCRVTIPSLIDQATCRVIEVAAAIEELTGRLLI